jgi:16S rRNA (adenine1518-N6/adenine1519-N6)-dimethyltransferase
MDSIRSTLGRLDVVPRRSMGQNFLRDDELARWLAGALEISPADTLVEIGPGTGAVTRHLAGSARRLVLIEKDRRLAAHLRETFGGDPRVEVIEADARETDLRPFFKRAPVKVLGNLPYSVGTPILLRWTATPSPVDRAVFMLQREVCERIVAAPGNGDYGRLSLRVQARWLAKLLRTIPPAAFHPRPAVESGVVALTPRPRESLPPFDEALFERLVRAGFAQRRKQLKNLLRIDPARWNELCAAIGAPVDARAEQLTLDQWAGLARALDAHPLKERAQNPDELFDVVDDTNRVVGRACRRDVHAQSLKHRAVHVFVFNSRGELLLQKRSHLKDLCGGKWDSSCAGHLDAGESYLDCATRELNEELGLTRVDSFRRIAPIAACPETGFEFVELYSASSDEAVHFPAAEIEAVHAFAPDEIREWARARPDDFAPGFLKCLEAFLDSAVSRISACRLSADASMEGSMRGRRK